jgi:hypothetical protein
VAGDKYLELSITGTIRNVDSTQESSGSADAGKIICLSSSGRIDPSMLLNLSSTTITASGITSVTADSPTVIRLHNESDTPEYMSILLPSASSVEEKVFFLVRDSASGSAVPIRTSYNDSIDGTITSYNLTYASDAICIHAQSDGWLILDRKFGSIPANFFVAGASSGGRSHPEPRALVSADVPVTYATNDLSFIVLATSSNLTNERQLTMGSGLQSRDAGAGSTLTIDRDDSKVEWWSQKNPNTAVTTINTTGTTLTPTTNGTAAASVDTDGQYVRYTTTTLANALGGWTSGTLTHTRIEFSPVLTMVMKTGPDADDVSGPDYYFGWSDQAITVGPNDKAYFDLVQDGSDYFWRCTSGQASSAGPPPVTRTETTTTGVQVTVDTRYVLRVELTTSYCKFYINNELVATHTTWLPDVGQGMNYHAVIINDNAGTAKAVKIARVHCRQN